MLVRTFFMAAISLLPAKSGHKKNLPFGRFFYLYEIFGRLEMP